MAYDLYRNVGRDGSGGASMIGEWFYSYHNRSVVSLHHQERTAPIVVAAGWNLFLQQESLLIQPSGGTVMANDRKKNLAGQKAILRNANSSNSTQKPLKLQGWEKYCDFYTRTK